MPRKTIAHDRSYLKASASLCSLVLGASPQRTPRSGIIVFLFNVFMAFARSFNKIWKSKCKNGLDYFRSSDLKKLQAGGEAH